MRRVSSREVQELIKKAERAINEPYIDVKTAMARSMIEALEKSDPTHNGAFSSN